MKRTSRWLAVCLAALGALAPLHESVAAQKVDREDYLGAPPLLNDNKTFVAIGDEYTETATFPPSVSCSKPSSPARSCCRGAEMIGTGTPRRPIAAALACRMS